LLSNALSLALSSRVPLVQPLMDALLRLLVNLSFDVSLRDKMVRRMPSSSLSISAAPVTRPARLAKSRKERLMLLRL